jgi:histidinol-phosphatase
VSAVSDLGEAHVSHDALHIWDGLGMARGLTEISAAARYTFGSAGFWAQMLVAEGRCDVSLDPWGKVWDNAAGQVIIEEAGGRYTDLRGGPRIDQDCAIVTNGLLHDEVLTRLTARRTPR